MQENLDILQNLKNANIVLLGKNEKMKQNFNEIISEKMFDKIAEVAEEYAVKNNSAIFWEAHLTINGEQFWDFKTGAKE